MMRSLLLLPLAAAVAVPGLAHDTWVETNTNVIRTGDAVYIDLKLGNHGNEHRDFKLAGKPNLQASELKVLSPDGSEYDLLSKLSDTGYAPNEGYWTGKFVPGVTGLHMVAHTLDQVVHYAPVRSVKSAKTFFVVNNSLDQVPIENPGFDRVLGHDLEIVPTTNPVTPMAAGQKMAIRLLYQGKPLGGARVSFIPRGQTLQDGWDADYDRETDNQGRASFTPKSGDVYLVVAHHADAEAAGEGYQSTKYSATVTIFVPELCSCCVE